MSSDEKSSLFLVGKLARNLIPESLKKKGVGYVVEQRGSQVKIEFRPSVFTNPPQLSEIRISDIKNVEILPSALDLIQSGSYDEPLKFDLKQKAAHLKIENRGGQLSNARTEILPHQIFTAHRIVSSSNRRFLLADEVGLGKTIEAGLVFQSLRLSGDVRRALIITPAGLARQWQDEMYEKFGVNFLVLNEDFLDKNPRIWDIQDLVIASIDTLKREDHKRGLIESRNWDLIIFDEAHRLSAKEYGEKVERTLNYRLALDLKDRATCLLLLTATPHQGDDSKFRNLVRLLVVDSTKGSLQKRSLQVPNYHDVIIRNRKSEVTDNRGEPIFKGKEVYTRRLKMYPEERHFQTALLKYLEEGYGKAEQDPENPVFRAIGFVMTTFQKLSTSSTEAITTSLKKRRELLIKRNGLVEGSPEYDARFEGEFEVSRAFQDPPSLFTKDEIHQPGSSP